MLCSNHSYTCAGHNDCRRTANEPAWHALTGRRLYAVLRPCHACAGHDRSRLWAGKSDAITCCAQNGPMHAQDMTTAGSVIVRQSSTKSAADDKGLDDRPHAGVGLCCGADPLLVATIAGMPGLLS